MSEACGWETGYENLLVDQLFDGHIKEGLEIDVYEWNFDKEKGYSVYERTLACGFVQKIILYQLEKLNDLESVFQQFFETDKFDLQQAYKGENRFYKNRYRAFIDYISLSEEYINSIYESKYVKHFYTEKQIAAFKKQWRC